MSISDYDKIWSQLQLSSLAGLYVSELHWLADSVVERSQKIFNETQAPAAGSYIKVDPGLHNELFALLSDAAKIRALILDRRRHKNQTDSTYRLQRRRIAWLAHDILADVHVNEILKSKLRNTVEHFDEYIDDTVLAIYENKIARPVNLPIDMTVWDESGLNILKGKTNNANLFSLRVYVAKAREFISFGKTINIGLLHEEASLIREKAALHLDSRTTEKGASVYVITDTSFSS